MKVADLYQEIMISSRLEEEVLYGAALHELEQGSRRDGLWAKAIAKNGGENDGTLALYLQYRVQAFRDDLAVYRIEQKKQEQENQTRKKESIITPPSKKRMTWNEKRELKKKTEDEAHQHRVRRIREALTGELGREPTNQEIEHAKWKKDYK